MSDLEQLSKLMDKKKAKEILKLTKDYDKYILNFKQKISILLEPHNIEVKIGIAFIQKETGDINGSSN